jgi:tRNA dimethylallyltransferase
MGVSMASNIKEADFVVVNMCSVRQTAVDRVHGQSNALRRLKRQNKGLKTILTGCVLEPDKPKMDKVFDFILDKNDLANWPEILHSKCTPKQPKDYLEITPVYESKIQAYVPISNGCDNYCTYCAVPYTRGKMVSRSHKSILKEIQALALKGYKEIWLLGENVNGYISPKDKKIDFVELIKLIDNIEGDFWLRFTSPHPKYFSEKLVDVLAKAEKFAPYLNLPAQAGDNIILRKMNRPYTAEAYIKLVKKIRKSFEKYRQGTDKILGLSTDIIIGFPTETKEQFNNTAKLMRESEFDMAFISQYSPRPQSFCYSNLKDDVTKNEKRQRDKSLNKILSEFALKNSRLFLKKTIPMLVIEKQGEYYFGRTRQNKAIRFKALEKDLVGKFVNVKVTKVLPFSLEGELVKPKLIVIVGPTASGKTDLAIKLAKKFNGEIVSADSRLVYKGMDIGTAKPKDLKGVKHYMIDIVKPNEEFNAALFKEKATETINEIIKRGRVPFLVGGTGLYIRGVVENLDFPKILPNKKLRKELETKTAEQLFEIYQKLDPQGALKIDKHNTRRLIRAIEVCKSTGKSFWENRISNEPLYDVLELGINIQSDELQVRIEKRVKKMIKSGLEKEVKGLFKKYNSKLAPFNTIGYAEWRDYFKRKISKEQVELNITRNTIAFAKRQITWFKKEKSIQWINGNLETKEKVEKLIDRFLGLL